MRTTSFMSCCIKYIGRIRGYVGQVSCLQLECRCLHINNYTACWAPISWRGSKGKTMMISQADRYGGVKRKLDLLLGFEHVGGFISWPACWAVVLTQWIIHSLSGLLEVTPETSYWNGVFIKLSLAVNCCDFHGSPLSDKTKLKIRIGKTICALYTISIKGLTPYPLFLLSRGCEPLHVTALCCFCVGTALSTHVTPLICLSLSTNLMRPVCQAWESEKKKKPLPQTKHVITPWNCFTTGCVGGERNIWVSRRQKWENRGRKSVSWDFSLLLPLRFLSSSVMLQFWPPQLQLCFSVPSCCFLSSPDELYEQC